MQTTDSTSRVADQYVEAMFSQESAAGAVDKSPSTVKLDLRRLRDLVDEPIRSQVEDIYQRIDAISSEFRGIKRLTYGR